MRWKVVYVPKHLSLERALNALWHDGFVVFSVHASADLSNHEITAYSKDESADVPGVGEKP